MYDLSRYERLEREIRAEGKKIKILMLIGLLALLLFIAYTCVAFYQIIHSPCPECPSVEYKQPSN